MAYIFLTVLFVLATPHPTVGSSEGPVIVGTVTFHGIVPPPQKVKVKRDPDVCGSTMVIQPLSVHSTSAGVKDVIVSIDNDSPTSQKVPLPATVLKNQGCQFIPRVVPSRIGEDLLIINGDPMLHNTHIKHGRGTFLNVAQAPGARPIQKTIRKKGLYQLACDAHPFMRGYILAFSHPFFSATNEMGQFRIKDIPPGEQTISVWHETLGTLQKKIHVPSHGEVTVQFEYPRK